MSGTNRERKSCPVVQAAELRSTAIAIGLFASVCAAQPAAQQTIDDIIKKGTIVVGVSTTTPIFGLIGKDGEPEGYDPDVARLLAKYLGVKVEFVPVTGANRIPQLLSGRVDVLICLFGITPERAQQVWYSMPYAYEAARSTRAGPNVKTTMTSRASASACRGRHAGHDDAPLAQGKGFQLQRFDDEATELRHDRRPDRSGGTGLLVNTAERNDPGKDYRSR